MFFEALGSAGGCGGGGGAIFGGQIFVTPFLACFDFSSGGGGGGIGASDFTRFSGAIAGGTISTFSMLGGVGGGGGGSSLLCA